MCRKSKFCTLLGDDPGIWNKTVPLPPPIWFDAQLNVFAKSVAMAAAGQKVEAIEILRTIRSDEIRLWFVEHGQVSGVYRAKQLGVPSVTIAREMFDPIASTSRFERSVFERDSYTCRYCGLRQVAKSVLRAFENVVGTVEFRTQGTNAQQHGVIHAF